MPSRWPVIRHRPPIARCPPRPSSGWRTARDDPSQRRHRARGRHHRRPGPGPGGPESGPPRITLGIVNSMPTAARKSTRRQFTEVISAAAQIPIGIWWFTMEACDSYEPIERLWESNLDGLIVTGREPRSDLLTDDLIGHNSSKRWIGRNITRCPAIGRAWRLMRRLFNSTALSAERLPRKFPVFTSAKKRLITLFPRTCVRSGRFPIPGATIWLSGTWPLWVSASVAVFDCRRGCSLQKSS